MSELSLISNTLSHEERIRARIESFRRDILAGDCEVDYINEILEACLDYLSEYEDEDIFFSTVKIKESMFYLDNFMRY